MFQIVSQEALTRLLLEKWIPNKNSSGRPELNRRSGRLTLSAACLHAVVLPFVGAASRRPTFSTQAWQESLLIRRDAFRPAHQLAGMPRVFPYSSRRHPLGPVGSALSRCVSRRCISLVCFKTI